MPISRSADGRRLAVTLGDPAGIGPETALRALSRSRALASSALLVGKASFYSCLSSRLKLRLQFADVSDPGSSASGRIACYFPGKMPDSIPLGRPSAAAAKLAVESIRLGAGLALAGKVAALVTAPINKAALLKAGCREPGHTELLAKLSGARRVEMMLIGGGLRVVPVTRHVALRRVPSLLKVSGIAACIELTIAELRRSFGLKRPRVVVCGLNPHAGEEGRFGDEESRVIRPAVARACARSRGAEIVGPLSPDALFHDAYAGRYDAVVCMYHDQGLIPLKMVSRGSGVNFTLGLPFVRTSPDHGTAYDIAPRFCADAGSMLEAMELARRLSARRRA